MEPTDASWGKGEDDGERLTGKGQDSGAEAALRKDQNCQSVNGHGGRGKGALSIRLSSWRRPASQAKRGNRPQPSFLFPALTVYFSRDYSQRDLGTEIHCGGAQENDSGPRVRGKGRWRRDGTTITPLPSRTLKAQKEKAIYATSKKSCTESQHPLAQCGNGSPLTQARLASCSIFRAILPLFRLKPPFGLLCLLSDDIYYPPSQIMRSSQIVIYKIKNVSNFCAICVGNISIVHNIPK